VGQGGAIKAALPGLLSLQPRANGAQGFKLITRYLVQCAESTMRIILTILAVLCVLIAASHIGIALVFEQPLMKYAWPFVSLAAANLFCAWVCGPSGKPRKHLIRP